MDRKHSIKKDIKKSFPELLKKSMGIVSTACSSAKISRSTYYQWREADKEFAKECDEVVEFTADFVESMLLSKIKQGDTTCIIFYCKTKLKNRGYVERIEKIGEEKLSISLDPSTLTDEQLFKVIEKGTIE